MALGTTTQVYQGELVQWDDVNRRGTTHAAAGKMFLGVSEDSEPFDRSSDIRGAIGLQVQRDEIRVYQRGVWKFKTTSGETYRHRTPVAMGADTQTVTTVIAGNTVVGYVWQPDGDSVSGAAGTDIEVQLLGSKEAALTGRNFDWTITTPKMASADTGTDQTHPLVVSLNEDDYLLRANVLSSVAISGSAIFHIDVYNSAGSLMGTAFTRTVQTGTTVAAFTPFALTANTVTQGTQGDSLVFVNDQQGAGTLFPGLAVTVEYLPKN